MLEFNLSLSDVLAIPKIEDIIFREDEIEVAIRFEEGFGYILCPVSPKEFPDVAICKKVDMSKYGVLRFKIKDVKEKNLIMQSRILSLLRRWHEAGSVNHDNVLYLIWKYFFPISSVFPPSSNRKNEYTFESRDYYFNLVCDSSFRKLLQELDEYKDRVNRNGWMKEIDDVKIKGGIKGDEEGMLIWDMYYDYKVRFYNNLQVFKSSGRCSYTISPTDSFSINGPSFSYDRKVKIEKLPFFYHEGGFIKDVCSADITLIDRIFNVKSYSSFKVYAIIEVVPIRGGVYCQTIKSDRIRLERDIDCIVKRVSTYYSPDQLEKIIRLSTLFLSKLHVACSLLG